MKITKNSIKKLVPDHIYKAGSQIYSRQGVTSFTKSGNRAGALVKGYGSSVFKVALTFETKGRMRSECSCPFNKLCKHVVALLLCLAEEESGEKSRIVKRKKVSTIIEKKEAPESKIIDLEKTPFLPGRFAGLEKQFLHYSNLAASKGPGRSAGEAIFYLQLEESFKNRSEQGVTGSGKPLDVFCRLGMMTGGDDETEKSLFTHFDPAALTKKMTSSREKELFNSLLFRREYRENLRLCPVFPLITAGLPVYLNLDNTLVRGDFKALEKIIITFSPDTLDSISDKPLFSPLFTCISKDSSGKEEAHLLEGAPSVYDAGNYTLLFTGSQRVYYLAGGLQSRLLISLIAARGGILAGEIRELKGCAGAAGEHEVEISFPYTQVRAVSVPMKPLLEVSPGPAGTMIDLLFDYGGRKTAFGSSSVVPSKEERSEKILETVVRNRKDEIKIKGYLSRLFEKIQLRSTDLNSITEAYPVFCIKLNVNDFLAKYAAELTEAGFEIILGEARKRYDLSDFRLDVEIASEHDAFFEVHLVAKDKNGNSYHVNWDNESVKNGIIELEDRYAALKEKEISFFSYLTEGREIWKGNIRIPRFDFEAVKKLSEKAAGNVKALEKSRELARALENFEKIPRRQPPKHFKGTLRNYQKAGYDWLTFLHSAGLGGCLADDMGLGKTVQTLSLLQYLKEQNQLNTVCLVAPVSTLANWEHELKSFTPNLTYYRHHGANRKQSAEDLEKTDLVIVSYHTLRQDIELFKQAGFSQVILDESHYIKNPASQIFKAVNSLGTCFRLCLTGTPLENKTADLWSQMHFLNPGLLGTESSFKERFAAPIENSKDTEAAARLRKLVSPFILRRKKEDVARDLPEKEEIVCYCEMGSEQRQFYNSLKEKYLEKITSSIEEKGMEGSAMTILEALLKLRQAALFPALADPEQKDTASAKSLLMEEMLEEILEEDHKVLIFSQFVGVLKRLRTGFHEKEIPYAYLDGSTVKREQQIKKFQEKSSIPVFLLSLKAAGVGINLTAADYVFLFDPWWNPAVENQAIDRAHRIGQKRKVIVYRFIVKDTIEEKIMLLKEHKKALADNLIVTEETFYKSLTKDDIRELF